jgi:uncharacterized membrane protein
MVSVEIGTLNQIEKPCLYRYTMVTSALDQVEDNELERFSIISDIGSQKDSF